MYVRASIVLACHNLDGDGGGVGLMLLLTMTGFAAFRSQSKAHTSEIESLSILVELLPSD